MAEKVYAPAPAPGPIEKRCSGKGAAEKSRIKAQAFGGLSLSGFAYTLDGYTVTVASGPLVKVTPDGRGVIGVTIASLVSPAGVFLPIGDGTHWFVNPPVKVPAGTWRTETLGGEPVDVENHVEDLVAAAKRILLDAALRYAAGSAG